MIRRADLDSRWQIEDDSLIASPGLAPGRLNSLTHSERKVRLSLRECFGTVFVFEHGPVFGCRLLSQLPDDLGVSDCEVHRLLLRVPKDNFAETRACSVVHVHNSTLGAG